MRKIKFRAWDTQHNEWFEGGKGHSLKWFHHLRPLFEEKVEYMQHTGLKDKNGKEIYEGDVVKYDYGQIGAIEFRHGAFRANFNMKVLNPYLHVWLEDKELPQLEVIGNIYENPELLENI